MEQTLAVDSHVPPNSPNCGICHWRSERDNLPPTLGTYPAHVQRLSKLQRFLGSVSTCLSSRNAPLCRQRQRTNQSYGTLVLHFATILWTLRQKDIVLFKIPYHARNRNQTFYHSIQSITCYLTTTQFRYPRIFLDHRRQGL